MSGTNNNNTTTRQHDNTNSEQQHTGCWLNTSSVALLNNHNTAINTNQKQHSRTHLHTTSSTLNSQKVLLLYPPSLATPQSNSIQVTMGAVQTQPTAKAKEAEEVKEIEEEEEADEPEDLERIIDVKGVKIEELEEIEKADEPEEEEYDMINRESGSITHSTSEDGSATAEGSEMEPFLSYRSKIKQLLATVGLAGYSIGEIQHGYMFQNCVYGLTPIAKSSNLDNVKEQQQYILRVPSCPIFEQDDGICHAIVNGVALTEYLSTSLSVSVPRVKAYSATTDNALGAPFTIQTRIPG